ncbi:DUF4091 domain-containing protein [Nibrella saemangeumensis]|uniref:DUF4091 domain-containing protein n=1 Tax=Nibrella saemangeumensis TaxID=1084526 RepID=A0ABP8NU09_9BACT
MKYLLLAGLLLTGQYLSAQPLAQSYTELPNPKPINQASWQAVKAGTYVSFASPDVRYEKHTAPTAALTPQWSTKAWRGEKVHTQLLIWTTKPLDPVSLVWSDLRNNKGNTIPAGQVKAGFVRYVMTDALNPDGTGCGNRKVVDFDSSLVADAIDMVQPLAIPQQTTQPVWLSVSVPANTPPGMYKGTVTIKTGQNSQLTPLEYTIEVLNHTLPAPKDWRFHLDLWQSPYAVARMHNVKPWSPEHMAAMKPYMQMLANAGQKVITATIIHDPWRSQTEDVYGSMVRWVKKRDGSWTYDYAIFDQWVNYMMALGIDQQINCYSMIPWDLKFAYYDEAARKDTFLIAKTGTSEYDNHWRPMLTDFARHLKQKGWFGKTTIAMDERPMAAMQQALQVIKNVDKNFKVVLAGNYHPEIQQDLADYSIASNQVIEPATLQQRKERGQKTTFYTACPEGYPNTFTFSPPAEATWLAWHSAHKGYDGYLRWAYNSWVKDPLRDSRFRSWAAGDTYFVYPGPRTSLRFERLIEGIQDYEKIRILKEQFQKNNQTDKLQQLEQVLKGFEIANLKATPAGEQLQAAKSMLNSL